jgi:hypothetical protein
VLLKLNSIFVTFLRRNKNTKNIKNTLAETWS